MNIYKVTRPKEELDWMEFSGMIVAAENEDMARRIYPGWVDGHSREDGAFVLPQEFTKFQEFDEWLDEWTRKDINTLIVEYIGTTDIYAFPWVILAVNTGA